MYNVISNASNIYSIEKNETDPHITQVDIQKYIGYKIKFLIKIRKVYFWVLLNRKFK